MAFSIEYSSPTISQINTIHNIDGSGALFLLRKIMDSTEFSHKPLKAEDWQKTGDEIIDRYLEYSRKETEKDIKQLNQIRANIGNCPFKEIFDAALLESNGTARVSNPLVKDREIPYNQVYAEQLLSWMHEEAKKISSSSFLMLTNIWQAFMDPSICLNKEVWKEYLSCEKWSAKQKKTLVDFKFKYDIIHNFYSLQSSPILKMQRASRNLKAECALWRKSVDSLIQSVDSEKKRVLLKQLFRAYQLLDNKQEIDKEFTVKFTRIVSFVREDLEQIRKDEQINPIFTVLRKETVSRRGLEQTKKNEQIDSIVTIEFELQEKNTIQNNNFSAVLFLSKYLLDLLEREKEEIDALENTQVQKYTASMEMSTKHLEEIFKNCSRKNSISPSKKKVKKKKLFNKKSLPITSKARETLEPEKKETLKSTPLEPFKQVDTFEEINSYLHQLKSNENLSLKGILSRTLESYLQQLRADLLKTGISDDLKFLYKQKTKEIRDHLLIGAAGLELMAQAIYDQRTEHIALGFRDSLIHCYYAVEQTLSQRILLKENSMLYEVSKFHDLCRLAEVATIVGVKKWEEFLKKINLHLAFCYPAKYYDINPEALSLMGKLSNEPKAVKKDTIIKAVKLCFEMYAKSIVFITEVSCIKIENQPEILTVLQSLQEQVTERVYILPRTAASFAKMTAEPSEQSLSAKIEQGLNHLKPFMKRDLYLKDDRIHGALATINSYLQLMKTSLEIPQDAREHSLQVFIKVETLAHIDKLFKHLFTATHLLQSGEETHLHDLTKLFDLVSPFYRKDQKSVKNIKAHLKEINMMIHHHYFYHTGKRKIALQVLYDKILKRALLQIHTPDDQYRASCKDKDPTQFRKNTIQALELIENSFNLFLDLLKDTILVAEEQCFVNHRDLKKA